MIDVDFTHTDASATITRFADVFETWDWPLPAEPYVPGQSIRPDNDDQVHHVARLAPNHTDPQQWRANAAYLAGHRLYDNAYYWEAHEVWEPVWIGARPNSRERFLIQGLIQLANAGLKLRMRRRPAATRLARMAAAHFHDCAAGIGAPAAIMAIDAAAVAESTERFAVALAQDTNQDVSPPRILVADGVRALLKNPKRRMVDRSSDALSSTVLPDVST